MRRILFIFFIGVCVASCSPKNESYDRKEIAHAMSYINSKKYDAAIKILKEIEVKQPNDASVQFLLGTAVLFRDVYDEHGEVKSAMRANEGLSHLAKAVEAVPENVKYGLSYSVALAEVGQCKKALPIFFRYYEDLKHEQLASAKIIYVRYAQCLVEDGDTAEALSVLSDLEQSGSVDPEVLKKANAVRQSIK